jgi:hypothetical protein
MSLVNSYWTDFENEETPSQPVVGPADLRDVEQLLNAVRALMVRVREIRPPPLGLASLESIFKTKIESQRPDRFVLRNIEAKLLNLLESPLGDELIEATVAGLEDWAHLAGFARRMELRLSRGEPSRHLRDLIARYLERVASSIPRKAKQGGGLDEYRRGLTLAIETRLATMQRQSEERRRIVRDIAAYGDILLLHVAYCTIQQILSALYDRDDSSAPLRRLERYVDIWPSRADSTWEQAVSLAENNLSISAIEICARLSPPPLDRNS